MDNIHYSWKDLKAADKEWAKEVLKKEIVKLSPIETGLEPKLSKGSPIKAVLFDIYGTVLISGTGDISLSKEKENHFSVESILEQSGLSLSLSNPDKDINLALLNEIHKSHHEQRALGAQFPEVDIIHIWDKVLTFFLNREVLPQRYSLKSLIHLSAYHEIISNPVWEMPHAFKTLKNIAAKLPMGIVSNAQYYTPLTLEILAETSLDDLGFTEDLCSWSYQLLRGKPSKEIFKAPLEKLEARGIKPEEVLYVGNDMLNDVYTASLWGCQTALFAGDKRSLRLREEDSRCSQLTPDFIITDLSQLEEIL